MSISHNDMVFAVGPDGKQTAAGFHVDSFILQQDCQSPMRGGRKTRAKITERDRGWAVPAGLATFERVRNLLRQEQEPVPATAGGLVPDRLMTALEQLACLDNGRARRQSRKAPRTSRRRGTRKQLGRK